MSLTREDTAPDLFAQCDGCCHWFMVGRLKTDGARLLCVLCREN
jgi:hypothetical protein